MYAAMAVGAFIGIARWRAKPTCAYCGKGLRSMGLGRAPVCHHCGRDQP